jgi:hypothetical protein
MSQLELSLTLKYPTLKSYIHQCFINNQVPELLDFLSAIVLEEDSTEQ